MSEKLRETVARAIHAQMLGGGDYDQQYISPSGEIHTAAYIYEPMADAAIRAVIEALAAEAEQLTSQDFGKGAWVHQKEWQSFAYWLRGHIGDTEATG